MNSTQTKAMAMISIMHKIFKPLRAKGAFVISLMLALSANGFAQTLDSAKLDEFFDRLAEKNKAMGCLVIAKDGKDIYNRAIGYGVISDNKNKPLTRDSRFGIASITKTYTAVMILQLVEEGTLNLSDTLDNYYPQVTNAKQISIGHLLGHRSGIPDPHLDQTTQRDKNTRISRDEMLALIVKGKPEFEPGEKASYSNSGYFLLGLILEKATGQTYEHALQESILSKIGLKETYLVSERIEVNKNESQTYYRVGNAWKPGRETHPIIFEIVSTPGDMAKFVEALFDLKLISRESLNQMISIQDGEGFGMVTFTFADRTFHGHTGGGDNYGSWLMYLPEEKLAISYATNAKVYPVKNIISGVIDIYYNRPFEIPSFDSIEVDPKILDQYVGIYSSTTVPVKWTITRDGETLTVRAGDEKGGAEIEATSESSFQLFEGKVTFEFDALKKQMIMKRFGLSFVFTKDQ